MTIYFATENGEIRITLPQGTEGTEIVIDASNPDLKLIRIFPYGTEQIGNQFKGVPFDVKPKENHSLIIQFIDGSWRLYMARTPVPQ